MTQSRKQIEKEKKRIRLIRKAILIGIKAIEKDDRFYSKPYTVTRILNYVLHWVILNKKGGLHQKLYSKDDMYNIWEIVRIAERRKELKRKNK